MTCSYLLESQGLNNFVDRNIYIFEGYQLFTYNFEINFEYHNWHNNNFIIVNS